MSSAQRGFGAIWGRVMLSPAALRLPPAAGLTRWAQHRRASWGPLGPREDPFRREVAPRRWAHHRGPTDSRRGGRVGRPQPTPEDMRGGLPLAVSPLFDREVMPRRGSTHRGVTGRQRRREAGELAPLGAGSAWGLRQGRRLFDTAVGPAQGGFVGAVGAAMLSLPP